jgi:hypothetical protein
MRIKLRRLTFFVAATFLAGTQFALGGPVNFYAFNGSLTDTGSSPITLAYSTNDSSQTPVYSNNVPAGYTGQSLSLDGNNSVAIGTPSSSQTVDAPYTFDAWVNVADLKNPRTFFGTRTGSDTSFDVKFGTVGQNGQGTDTGIHGDIGTGGGWLNTGADSAAFAYTPGTWYNVAYVVDTSSYTIYINGVESATNSLGGTALLYDMTHTLNIGNAGGGSNEYFSGDIFNLGIWNTALSAAEIQALASPVPEPTSFALLGLAAVGMAVVARRRRAG